jgi:N-methylhydantoinase A/oxoprolinase/acetone carboxylase beta subunit
MILGIDVGGTHTDVVCIKKGEVVSSLKVETFPDIVDSITAGVSSLNIDYNRVKRVVLSTTLTTNAIIENRLERAGMIVSAGPGVNPKYYFLNRDFHLVDGAMDHRGREYIPLDESGVERTALILKDSGINSVGIVSKFSVRNHYHELRIKSLIDGRFKYITMGHQMSGSLNFPRRIHTVFFNAGVLPVQARFISSVREAFAGLGIRSRILFLKADGGTFSSSAAERLPVETIISGPAASIMGAFALRPDEKCAAVLDIGGTTTDIGLLALGLPVFEPQGISIKGLKTLVRGLKTVSVGAGGDSAVSVNKGVITVGPSRKGAPCCLGGTVPTVMDALRVLDHVKTGNKDKAVKAISDIASAYRMNVEETAKAIIRQMVGIIKNAYTDFLEDVNANPVYTIYEMLHPETVKPEKLVLIGGPALALKPFIEDELGIACVVPENYDVANAIGAAVSKTTARITLLADTQRKQMICPELEAEDIISPAFTIEDLKSTGEKLLNRHAVFLGLADDYGIDIVEEQCFNMVSGFRTVGRNMRLKLQTRPGIIPEFRKKASR